MPTQHKQQTRPAALVTGGATRLGLAFAKALASTGHDIALHYHSSAKVAEHVVSEIQSMNVDCRAFQQDLSLPDCDGMIASVMDQFPNCKVLVNSASAYEAATIADTDVHLLQQQFAVNFFAPFMLTRAFANQVCVNTGDTGIQGSIINILDNKIAFQQNSYAAYLLSKKTLAEFTRLSAIEFAPSLRINAIAPGVVMPGDSRTEDYIKWRVEGIPLKKQGSVGELIKAMNYLLTNDFVTGQILTVDGGESLNAVGLNAEQYREKEH